MTFNPFSKRPRQDLSEEDLNTLVQGQVAEGYFVEYKRSFPSAAQIGHTLASLANTNGGWYFVGIDAPERLPVSVPGISTVEFPNPISRITEVAKTHIDPTPLLHPQTIRLGNGNVVVAVYIPSEQQTPFVTKDGRIYRRVVDSSVPVAESNRLAIDRLLDQGRAIGERFAKFCVDERAAAQSEAEQPWVSIFLSPYPHDPSAILLDPGESSTTRRLLDASREPFEILVLDDGAKITGNLPFGSAWPTERSVVLRQAPHATPFRALTAEFFADGRAKLHIPLGRYALLNARTAGLRSTPVITAIDNIDDNHRSLLRFFDIDKLLLSVAALLSFYRVHILADQGVEHLQIAVTGEECWRLAPLVDQDDWGDHIGVFGPPYCERSEFRIPEDLSRPARIENDRLAWMAVGTWIAAAFGIPRTLYPVVFGEALAQAARNSQ